MSSRKTGRSGEGTVEAILAKYSREKRNLIPLLHDLQAQLGWLSPEAMEAAAEHLGTSASQVHGVATFYSMFSTKPLGEYVVRACDSTPCHIEGSKRIREAIQRELGIPPGETTQDGLFSFEVVSCLGLCGVAPAMTVNGDVYGNLKPEMIPGILAGYREED